MLAFLPHSADASSSTIREKEDSVAILSGEQKENMPAGLGAWVPAETTQGQGMEKHWVRSSTWKDPVL